MTAPDHTLPVKVLDSAGMSVSALCAVHCVASAAFTTALSLVGLNVVSSMPWLEWAFLGTSATLGALAFASGYRVHRCITPSPLFVGGILTLVAARLLPEHLERMESSLVVVGACAIITAHWLNWHRRACCRTNVPKVP